MDDSRMIGYTTKKMTSPFSKSAYLRSLAMGVLFLVVSLVINFFAAIYSTDRASNPVTDIVLSNTNVHNVGGIFTYGALFFIGIIVVVCITSLRSIPFVLKTIALFTIIRSGFISLTHVSIYPNHVLITSPFFANRYLEGIFTGNDLFFSGHTGLPFLMALMFWDTPRYRFVFLGFSISFAIIVLLGHLHYSIDVASAFFITYGIFEIAKRMFAHDWSLFLSARPTPQKPESHIS